MKYLTKEWYEIMQRSDLHLGLKPIEEARTFSESLFQQLYAECEQEHIDFEKSACDIDMKELAREFSNPPSRRVDNTPATEEEQQVAAEFQQIIANALLNIPKRVFDLEKARDAFQRLYLGSLESVQRKLPDNIRQKIADLRVFALQYAAPEIIEEVAAYAHACNAFVKQTLKECIAQQKSMFKDCHPTFLDRYDIHDYHVESAHFSGKDFVLTPSNLHGFIYTFHNAEILVWEHALDHACLLYDEIYPLDSGYEFHFLYQHPAGGGYDISQLVLRCSNLEITT